MTTKERVAIYVRMPRSAIARAKAAAKKDGRTLASWVRVVIEQAVKEAEK